MFLFSKIKFKLFLQFQFHLRREKYRNQIEGRLRPQFLCKTPRFRLGAFPRHIAYRTKCSLSLWRFESTLAGRRKRLNPRFSFKK